MSYKSSNLYASKVFSEHPLALWAMDESINFISMIPESAKEINLSDWNITNASIVDTFIAPVENPIENSVVNKIYRSSSSTSYVKMVSDEISYSSKIDTAKGSLCFNSFVYVPDSTLLLNIKIGFIINGVEYYKEYSDINTNKWKKVEFTKDLTTTNNISCFIKAEYLTASTGEDSSSIFLSGISVGQWSEPFNSFDTGFHTESIPASISNLIDAPAGLIKCLPLDPYGFNNEDLGYAIEYDKSLLTETYGIPMVYGSKNSVSILSKKQLNIFENFVDGGGSSTTVFSEVIDGGSFSSTYTTSIDGGNASYSATDVEIPSLVLPGKGFLNRSGIYSNITVEMWTKINNESTDPVRILGPLSSSDGLYVHKEFITVKVGKYVKSYFIGQWYRPMLLHFGQTANEIYLMINGEKVISIEISSLDISTFPNPEEDFLGVFGHHEIHPFEIDMFSIFPYVVTEQVAKRRFVYGQGVENQESIIASLGGDLTYVDFPYSGYSSTISYPDRTPWTNGYSNNLSVTDSGLTLPSLTMPDLIFKNNLESSSSEESQIVWSSFEYDNFEIQDEEFPFISMLPNSTYDSFDSTLYFSSLNKTGDQAKSIYAVLKTGSDISTNQSILYFSNSTNINYFEARIISGSIQYIYNDSVIYSKAVSQHEEISVGLDFDKIMQTYPQVNSFFSNTDIVSLNLAGIQGNTFLGKLFSLTINNEFFTEKDGYLFSNGFAVNNSEMYSYVGSYTLLAKKSNLTVFLDIAATGYWESSVPLAYFGKYVTSSNGSKYYDLDLIQFNIDIPATLYSRDTEDSILYQQKMVAKSYVTLQTKNNVGMIPYTDYINTVAIGNKRVLDFDSDVDTANTKFEICDSTVIFPPKENVDFKDYYITIHILVTSSGINTENIMIKKMSFSSMAFDESKFYTIGSPTGRSIYPISKIDNNYIYKTKVPVIIDNESSSYMYISGNSGISVLPEENTEILKGISFPINETLKADFNMDGIQMYLMFNENDFFAEEKLVGKFFNNLQEYLIYLTPELDQKRGIIRIVDSATGLDISGIRFFLNGKEVSSIVVRPFKWNSIIISLQDVGLSFYQEISPGVSEGISGQLEIYSGVRVDNVSVFSDINEVKLNLTVRQPWYGVVPSTWATLSSQTWKLVLNEELIPITVLSVDGASIFDTYNGLSYVVGDDDSVLNVNFDSIGVLNDIDWTTFEYKPI